MDIPYVKLYDENLNQVGIIVDYTSLIWNKKYKGVGNCEVYAKVDQQRFQMVNSSRFLMRSDDTMMCIIKKVEVTTDVEAGDFIIITGQDCSCFLDQRIVWNPSTFNDTVENIIRDLVEVSLIHLDAPNDRRNIYTDDYGQFLFLGDKANFSESTVTQISYKNVGEKVREFCSIYGWGYKLEYTNYVPDANHNVNLLFKLYRGNDLTQKVVFSDANYNLISSKYTIDKSNWYNVARIGGEGENVNRTLVHTGDTESFERNELFVDEKGTSSTFKFSDVKKAYPGGITDWDENKQCYVYFRLLSNTNLIIIPIVSDTQLEYLEAAFPWGEVSGSGTDRVFEIGSSQNPWDPDRVFIANIYNESTEYPTDESDAVLQGMFYKNLLFQPGLDALAGKIIVKTLDAQINPYGIFKYRESWNLGDIIKIETKFGFSTTARIAEVLESFSSDGYSVEPKLEYLTEG